MNRSRRLLWVLPLGLLPLLAACPTGSDGASGSASDPVDAGPPPPPFDVRDDALDVVRLQILVEGQPTQELQGPLPTEPVPVPVGATLRLETWQRLDDFRVRLVTDSDRLVAYRLESGPVAARAGGHPAPGGTWIALEPTEALRPGDPYTLKIESERGERVVDAEGRTYGDLVLPLEIVAAADPGPEAADGGSER